MRTPFDSLVLPALGAACAALLLADGPVRADCAGVGTGYPFPNSTIPCGINLVGLQNGLADPQGKITMVVRDLANNPVVGCDVSVDFSGCLPDIRIATVQPWPGLRLECTAAPGGAAAVGIVHGITDANGIVTMSIVGGASNTVGGAPGAGFRCATVYAGAVNLGTINVGAFDQNAAGGVNPSDVSMVISDVLRGVVVGRSDLNCTSSINVADISLELRASLAAQSQGIASAADYCH
jgi:hypothetical protein